MHSQTSYWAYPVFSRYPGQRPQVRPHELALFECSTSGTKAVSISVVSLSLSKTYECLSTFPGNALMLVPSSAWIHHLHVLYHDQCRFLRTIFKFFCFKSNFAPMKQSHCLSHKLKLSDVCQHELLDTRIPLTFYIKSMLDMYHND